MTDHVQTQATASEHCPPIVIRGLPGIGKTTLANAVISQLRALGLSPFQVNADVVRSSVNKDLGFSPAERIENARRIGAMTFLASTNGVIPVVDFVMPTKVTFDVFAESCGIPNLNLWSLIPNEDFRSRFPDTVKMFEPLADWWGGAVFPHLFRIAPYPEDEVQEVANRIVTYYIANRK